MTVYSFSVSVADEIGGWQSGASLPTGNVEVTQADITAYNDAQQTLRSQGRSERPLWLLGAVSIPTDVRPIFRLSCNRANDAQLSAPVLDADGVDGVTVTLEKMSDDTTVDTTLQGPLILTTASGRTWRFTFVDGVATKVFKTSVSGSFDVESNPSFRLLAPFKLVAVE